MERPAGRERWRDYALTFAAAYGAVTVAGTLASLLPGELVGRVGALLLVTLLVSLYAAAAAPGRRAHWAAYLLAGVLCPPVLMLLAAFTYALPLPYEAFTITEALAAGFGVGVRVTGDSDPARGPTILAVTFSLWWLGIAVAVLLAAMIRGLLRRSA